MNPHPVDRRTAEKAKEVARVQLYRQQKNATMSPKERAAQKAEQAQARKLSRQQKNATMSPEERAAQKAKQAQARKLSRQQKNAAMSENALLTYLHIQLALIKLSEVTSASSRLILTIQDQ